MTELIPLKNARMAATPFTFFRGSAPLMAADLSALPRTGIEVQICGDAHVQNLGAFGGGPDGHLIFDINDFDETIHAPWEWDVKRMAASLVLAGRESRNSERQCKDAVLAFGHKYREKMRQFSEFPVLELARYLVLRELQVSPVRAVLRKAERCTPLDSLQKLTERKGGQYQFKSCSIPRSAFRCNTGWTRRLRRRCWPRCRVCENVAARAPSFLRAIQGGGCRVSGCRDRQRRHPRLCRADVWRRGAGSALPPVEAGVAIRLCTLSAQGRSAASPRTTRGRRRPPHAGAVRHLSGWATIEGRPYLVRQLRDHKAGIEATDLEGKGLVQYAEVCGELLAKGHARSGDPCMLSGYLGTSDRFDQALVDFAVDYADQTTRDFEAWLKGIREGRVKVVKPAAPCEELRKEEEQPQEEVRRQALAVTRPLLSSIPRLFLWLGFE